MTNHIEGVLKTGSISTKEDMAAVCREWTPESLIAFYNWIYIDDMEITFPTHLVPVAYALCDIRINRLMLLIGPGSGKSNLISKIYPAWLLGHNPKKQVLVVSAAEDLPLGFVAGVKSYIESSEAFKLSFPDVLPDKSRGWSADSGLFVTGSMVGSSDASYSAYGIESSVLTGKHGNVVILDDVHNLDNTSTIERANKVMDIYVTQIVGRADARGGRFILTGRRWKTYDMYGRLKDNGDWTVMTLPAEREGSKHLYYDITLPSWTNINKKTKKFDCVFTDGCCLLPNGVMHRVIDADKLPPIREINDS